MDKAPRVASGNASVPGAPPALELQGVVKRFGGVVAVDGVDLVVSPGEFFVLLGPSGCGKSTLLRLVAGLERPTAGRIYIHGREVTHLEPRERDVAMVFQSYALYPHLTVRENLAFPLRVRREPREAIATRVEEVARMLQIEELLDRKPRELSGGQRQRVAIGRALVRRPHLFLFDEPLSNLDAQLRTTMRGELARLHRRLGTTVLYVTHDQVEAMTLGTRIALLHRGRLEQVGSPQEVYERPATAFVATFVGSPPMNLVEGETRDGVFQGKGLVWKAGVPPGATHLGIRPEDLLLEPGGPWTGQVDWVEALGAETLIHIRAGEALLVVRERGATRLPLGSRVSVRPRRLHWFGSDGRRLEPPGGATGDG